MKLLRHKSILEFVGFYLLPKDLESETPSAQLVRSPEFTAQNPEAIADAIADHQEFLVGSGHDLAIPVGFVPERLADLHQETLHKWLTGQGVVVRSDLPAPSVADPLPS